MVEGFSSGYGLELVLNRPIPSGERSGRGVRCLAAERGERGQEEGDKTRS
jgi:hypothetical protein